MADKTKTSGGPSDKGVFDKTPVKLIMTSDQKILDTGVTSSDSVSSTGNGGETKAEDAYSSEDFDLERASLVAKAADRLLEDDTAGISNGENAPHKFSHDYEVRKQQMLQTIFYETEKGSDKAKSSNRRKYPRAIPVTLAAALFVIVLSVGVNTADAMPEPIRQLVMQVRSLFSSASIDEWIDYGSNQATDYPDKIRTVYAPTVVLEGYTESERKLIGKQFYIRYSNGDDYEYIFQQRTLDYLFEYNQETVECEEVLINGVYQGMTYLKYNQRHIQWQQDDYVFELIAYNQSAETLKSVAASIKPTEEEK